MGNLKLEVGRDYCLSNKVRCRVVARYFDEDNEGRCLFLVHCCEKNGNFDLNFASWWCDEDGKPVASTGNPKFSPDIISKWNNFHDFKIGDAVRAWNEHPGSFGFYKIWGVFAGISDDSNAKVFVNKGFAPCIFKHCEKVTENMIINNAI